MGINPVLQAGLLNQSSAQVIDGSLAFNSTINSCLSRSFGSGNTKTWTLSFWVKNPQNSSTENRPLYTYGSGSGGNYVDIRFTTAGVFQVSDWSTYFVQTSSQMFRDQSGWYHFVVAVDTTISSPSSDRVKLYVNGVRTTKGGSDPNENYNFGVNNNQLHVIGASSDASGGNIGGSNFKLTGYNFIDGLSLGPGYFGFTDPLTGTWRPKKFRAEGTTVNDGTQWSSLVDVSNATVNNGSASNLFDGDTTTKININTGYIEIDLSSRNIQAGPEGIEVYNNEGGAYTSYQVNGGEAINWQASAGWMSMGGANSKINTIRINHLSGGGVNAAFAFRVNGVIMVDSTTTNLAFGTNGFYLPFDGNSPIGQDKSGKGNDWTPVNFGGSAGVDQATGALPILEGAGGAVANVGVRTDAYAANLVLALPLAGSPNDVSNQINSGSTTKTVTVNNNASPISRGNFYGASFDFDGNGDRLVLSNYGSDFTFDGDFTMECWLFIDDAATVSNPNGDRQIAGVWTGSNDDWLISYSGTGSHNIFLFQLYTGGSVEVISSGVNMSTYVNKWVHLAVVRNSNSIQCYVDGVAKGTPVSNSATFGQTSNVAVGGRVGGDAHTVAGSIQDFRIYKGVAKYTSNFIPASTSPDILPDTPSGVSGSSKLTKITDGAVTIPDNNSRLSLADSDDAFNLGSGDWTIEAFVYLDNVGGDNNVVFFQGYTSDYLSSQDRMIVSYITTGGIINIAQSTSGTDNYDEGYGNTPLGDNRWYHLAYVRNGSNLDVYVDGKKGTTRTARNLHNSSKDFCIGSSTDNVNGFDGFISNFRLVKGTALYTSNFTPPTAPLTNVTNTKLLCCQSNTSANSVAVSPATFSNSGDVYSSGISGSQDNTNGGGSAAAFDGQLGNEDGYGSYPNAGQTLTWTAANSDLGTTLAYSSTIRVYVNVDTNGDDGGLTVVGNNGSQTIDAGSAGGRWVDISAATSPITSIAWSRASSGSQGVTLVAVEVDGSLLIDGFNGKAIARAGDASATNFNPFITDINTVRGQETSYPTLNPLDMRVSTALSNGNLTVTGANADWYLARSTQFVSTGKYYWEYKWYGGAVTDSSGYQMGLKTPTSTLSASAQQTGSFAFQYTTIYQTAGSNNSVVISPGSVTPGDCVMFAYDADAGLMWFGVNGIWNDGANPATGTNSDWTSLPTTGLAPFAGVYNTTIKIDCNFGQKPFKYAPPDGFQPINAANVRPETVIARPDQYFGIVTYTGDDATSHSIKGLNFGTKPDFVWIKNRDQSEKHILHDTVRGVGNTLYSSSNSAADTGSTYSDRYKSFDFNGFTVGTTHTGTNSDGDDFVAWCWRAGGSSNTFNVDGVGYASASDVNMSIGGLNSSFYNQSQTWSNDLASDNGNYFGTHTPAKAFDGNLTSTKCTSSTGTGGTLTFDLSNNNLTGTLEVVTNTGMSVAVTHSGGTTTIAAATSPDQIETLNFGSLTSISQIVVTGVSAPSNAMLYGVKLNGAVLIDSGVSVTNFPTIAATGCSVGTKQGFSIVKYTGNSTANATLPHGLLEAPKFVIIKNLSNTYGWAVLHTDAGTTGTTLDGSPEYYMLYLPGDAGRDDWSQDTIWNPTSTTVKIDQSGGANWVNNSNSNYIMYAWHDVPGLQKFGLYIGNNNSSSPNGPFVELGFRPALVMIKRQNGTGNWIVYDNKRDTFNPLDGRLYWNTNSVNVDNSGYNIDFLSNGFRITGGNNDNYNASSNYVYAAWAEAPTFNLYGAQSNAR